MINTDAGFTVSNVASALLQGNPAAGIPTITSVNGKGLAATSSDPIFAVNNVETVVTQGAAVKVGGTGFDTVHGVAIDLFCSCAGGKVGPFFLNPGDPRLSATQLTFMLPANGMPTRQLLVRARCWSATRAWRRLTARKATPCQSRSARR